MTRLYTARLSSQVARVTWLVVVLLFCFSALIASLFLALAHITRLQTAKNDTSKFMLLLATIEEADGALSDMEVGNRGFLLTGDEKFRETFHHGRDIFSSRYKQLSAVMANEPVQRERLQSIKAKLTQWFDLYRPLIQKRQQEVQGSTSPQSTGSPRSPGSVSTTNSSRGNSLGKSSTISNSAINNAISNPAGKPLSRSESPEMSYGEQSALVLCNELFADIRFALDEIRTYEEKQSYENH